MNSRERGFSGREACQIYVTTLHMSLLSKPACYKCSKAFLPSFKAVDRTTVYNNLGFVCRLKGRMNENAPQTQHIMFWRRVSGISSHWKHRKLPGLILRVLFDVIYVIW